MTIKPVEITIKDLIEGFENNDEEGVVGYNGLLDIRPPYQREFIYNDKQRNAVIDTVLKGYPLNTMYWMKKDDGGFELLDGQQRTMSICLYSQGDFTVAVNGSPKGFNNLTSVQKKEFLDYKLNVYQCEGNEDERLSWFQTVNIAGVALNDQELLNAIYIGPWVTDAKRHFSKTKCAAKGLGGNYMTGVPIKQEYLEKVLKWKSNGHIKDYMAKHQNDSNCDELWMYFQDVIAWIQKIFPIYRVEMKSVEWGDLYNVYGSDNTLSPTELEKKVSKLYEDDDVTNQKGIYPYVLTHEEKWLNIRDFDKITKKHVYEKQGGICPYCAKEGNDVVYNIDDMEADHILPWALGGHTVESNCQLLCKHHNASKGKKY